MVVRGRTRVLVRRCRGIATVSGLPDPTAQTDRLRALGRALDRRGVRMLRLILGREGVVVAARVTTGLTAPITLRLTIAELDDLRVGARRERGEATSRSVGRPPSRLGTLSAGAAEPFATWAGDAVPLAYEEVLRLVGQLLATVGAAATRARPVSRCDCPSSRAASFGRYARSIARRCDDRSPPPAPGDPADRRIMGTAERWGWHSDVRNVADGAHDDGAGAGPDAASRASRAATGSSG